MCKNSSGRTPRLQKLPTNSWIVKNVFDNVIHSGAPLVENSLKNVLVAEHNQFRMQNYMQLKIALYTQYLLMVAITFKFVNANITVFHKCLVYFLYIRPLRFGFFDKSLVTCEITKIVLNSEMRADVKIIKDRQKCIYIL